MRFVIIKRWLSSLLIVLVLYVLQTSVFRFLPFGRTVPNLLVMICSIYGLLRGENDGIMAGFFCGLLLDIYFMKYLGFHSLIYIYIGFLTAKLRPFYEEKDYRIPALAIFMGDAISLLIEYLFYYVLHGQFRLAYYLRTVAAPELIFTMVMGFICFPPVFLLEKHVINILPKRPGEEKAEVLSITPPANPKDEE